MSLGFQVADVKKPLISVKRIVEKGNHVSFGPGDEDNFIINKENGDKMKLRPNERGSYRMDVSFVGGGKTEITVDSGAEENVCPWEWGLQFGTYLLEVFRNLVIPNRGGIRHYGMREVKVVSPF